VAQAGGGLAAEGEARVAQAGGGLAAESEARVAQAGGLAPEELPEQARQPVGEGTQGMIEKPGAEQRLGAPELAEESGGEPVDQPGTGRGASSGGEGSHAASGDRGGSAAMPGHLDSSGAGQAGERAAGPAGGLAPEELPEQARQPVGEGTQGMIEKPDAEQRLGAPELAEESGGEPVDQPGTGRGASSGGNDTTGTLCRYDDTPEMGGWTCRREDGKTWCYSPHGESRDHSDAWDRCYTIDTDQPMPYTGKRMDGGKPEDLGAPIGGRDHASGSFFVVVTRGDRGVGGGSSGADSGVQDVRMPGFDLQAVSQQQKETLEKLKNVMGMKHATTAAGIKKMK
jgi:hypothetical protein